MPPTPILGVTKECFLSETEIHDLVSAYIPEYTVTSDGLSTWIPRDGSWGMSSRKQVNERIQRE
ncbi:hypothetical protein CLU79DRAFT_712640 [Phycomyces nitens]|nr:hypothetical protein CLU79DRAFT_712640 [Phycomyces nitens]